MNYVDSFYNFLPNDGTTTLNELFSLHSEGGFMAKYNCEEFKNVFSGFLNESDQYMDEDSLNEAHSYYEMSMLAEARSSWGDTEGDINYIDAETHVILIKNSEAFVIEKKTFDMVQNINEWSLPSLSDIRDGFRNIKNKAVNYAKEKIGQAKKFVSKAWDKISNGAKKAWEWLKTAIAAVGKFIGDNIETITIVLSILSAVFGIAGGITTAVGVGPILTAIGGVLMALNGGLHIYEGFHKAHHGMEVLKKASIDPVSKYIAAFAKAGPDFLLGAIFLPLGFYDISHGLTEALVNPAAGSIGMGVKTTAKSAAKSWLGNAGHMIEKVLGGFVKELFKNPKIGAQVGVAAVGVSSVLLAKFFTDVCGWLYEFMLKSSAAIIKGINWLLGIPKRLTDAIDKFSKKADGFLSGIIAKGLSAIVKPMTSFLARICEKYFKPLVKRSEQFIQRQIAAKKILDAEMEKAHGGHGKGADTKKPGVVIKKTKGKSLVKLKTVKIDKRDIKMIKKVNKGIKKKTNESINYGMNYIKSFDELDFI